MDKYFCTFSFYDNSARRLGIFGRVIGKTIDIHIVTCSRKDDFRKEKARIIYEGRLNNGSNRGLSTAIQVDDDKPKWTFMQWCLKNYYKPQPVKLTYQAMVLMKGDEPLNRQPYYVGSMNLVDVNKVNKERQYVNRKGIQATGD